ncbi:MAG TPA: carboxymuconolactone decarboxylase family protein [Holophaga sp.]|nr:carboxymuconolactone decarboxylase family protein [Holophaga sp.]
MKIRENLDAMIERHPEIYDAYAAYGKAVHTLGGPLDERTRWLVKVATSAALGLEKAQITHMTKALDAGCAPEELEHAILLVAPTAGFPRMMEAMERFRAFRAAAGTGESAVRS